MDVKVSTIYSNSIEIEWKPGGVSDVAFYTVKYRQHPLDAEIDMDVDENDPIDFESLADDGSSDIPSLIDYYFKRLNTTSTKVKVGTSLKAFTLYEFRVVAVNLLGSSEETEPVLVRTAATSNHSFLIQFLC